VGFAVLLMLQKSSYRSGREWKGDRVGQPSATFKAWPPQHEVTLEYELLICLFIVVLFCLL
jgi:hypothetical protein